MILFSGDWLTVDMCFYLTMTKWQNLLLMLFPSVAFYNKHQNIGLVERDQLQRTLKKDKFKYQLFF